MFSNYNMGRVERICIPIKDSHIEIKNSTVNFDVEQIKLTHFSARGDFRDSILGKSIMKITIESKDFEFIASPINTVTLDDFSNIELLKELEKRTKSED